MADTVVVILFTVVPIASSGQSLYGFGMVERADDSMWEHMRATGAALVTGEARFYRQPDGCASRIVKPVALVRCKGCSVKPRGCLRSAPSGVCERQKKGHGKFRKQAPGDRGPVDVKASER